MHPHGEVGAVSGASQNIAAATSEAGRAGATVGTALGLSMILGLWVLGDIILGAFVLLTRGRKIITEETVE